MIAAIADEVHIPAGRSFITEGDRGRRFYAVVEGTVEVRRSGRKVPLKGSDQFFGELALISNAPRNATVTAVSPVKALAIPKSDFTKLLRRAGHLQFKLLSTMAERGTHPFASRVP